MRVRVATVVLTSVLAFPLVGSAQVYYSDTPPPAVTAASASWQLNGQPVFTAGNFYYPAGATVFFNGRVMTRTGSYEGVPLYSDVTLEPFSIVFVPIGGGRMRPYERRRDGELTGTVGSRTPSFPIGRDVELSAGTELEWPRDYVPGAGPRRVESEYVLVPRAMLADRRVPRVDEPFVAAGAVMVSPPGQATRRAPALALPQRSAVEGMWIEFAAARWYSAGRALDHDATRFERVGDYRGFPVFRERDGSDGRIYVTVTPDGPLAPYDRR